MMIYISVLVSLLELAKQAVETAIEQGEEKALKEEL